MAPKRDLRLVEFEGRQVSVALKDGSRVDDCQLISSGRPGVPSLWLVLGDTDHFVPLDRVVEVWEAANPAVRWVMNGAD